MYDFGGLVNFKNCYVNPEGTRIIVSIHSPEFVYHVKHYPCYLYDQKYKEINDDGTEVEFYYMVFGLSTTWEDDFLHFYLGEYSKFSRTAKRLITENSKLPYREYDEERRGTKTDLRLMALWRFPEMVEVAKQFWLEELGMELKDEDELVWPPNDTEFLTIPLREENPGS